MYRSEANAIRWARHYAKRDGAPMFVYTFRWQAPWSATLPSYAWQVYAIRDDSGRQGRCVGEMAADGMFTYDD